MILEDEIASYGGRYNEVGKANVVTFLQRWNIDQSALETFVRRAAPEGRLYYISTVARGLAGSTSDIDLVIIADDAAAASLTLTQMLFHQGRRIGIKAFGPEEVDAGVKALEKKLDLWRDGIFDTGSLPIRWNYLERLINGVTFDGEPEFIGHLPTISRWAGVSAFVAFNKALRLAQLACIADQGGAMRAYGEAALMSAMDVLMADCGRVQSNVKWVYERWRAFTGEVADERVVGDIRRIEDLRRIVVSTSIDGAALLDRLAGIRDHQTDQDPSLVGATDIAMVCAEDVAINDFLPDAVVLQGPRGAIVIARTALDDILHRPDLSDAKTASLALDLVQRGLLRVNRRRSEHV